VTRVTDNEADSVAEFMRRVWGSTVTGERIRRSLREGARTNPAVTGEPIPSVVYRRDDEALGYLGSIPVRFWNGRSEVAAHWLKGFMVLPEHQNGPVGFGLLREMLRHVDVAGTMTVAQPARRLFKAVGFTDCGALPNYIAVLRGGRVAQCVDVGVLGDAVPSVVRRGVVLARKTGVASVGGACAAIARRSWNALRALSITTSVDLSGSLPSQDAIDRLWLRVRQRVAAGTTRDGRYFHWRYDARRGGAYEVATVRERGARARLVGLAVVRRSGDSPDPRLSGLRLATLADILFDPRDERAGIAALKAAERLARRMGADALLCTTAHPAITRLLARRVYVKTTGGVHMMVREPRAERRLSTRVEDWWLMRGDANSDDAF
jgi:GNAT superfamily N-acetyltransferase